MAQQPTRTDQLDASGAAWSRTCRPTSAPGCAASEPVTLHESTAIIAVADEFTRNQLEGRLRTRLEDALGAAFGRQIRIAVTVDPELGGLDRPPTRADRGPRRTPDRDARPGRAPTDASTIDDDRR